jgi:phosphopantothenoylcysteine decarboxylase/phosphopantothenate--cysteine ligase
MLAVHGRRVILGVTGSIAVYKAAEIVRALKKEGADVRVVMTEAACRFVAPLTFDVLSGHKALAGLWEDQAGELMRLDSWEGGPVHLETRGADLVLIAPATANIIGKAACGVGDDLLSSLLLATKPPVLVAPAMNVNMLQNPVVQENLARLKNRGWIIIESEEGDLACGDEGAGRLASLEAVMSAVREALVPSSALAGLKVLVTAGRTEEPIDPVRYISNRSSGKMGFALAKAASRRGAEVTLVAGATSVEPPSGVEVVPAPTAGEMADEVKTRARDCSVLLMAAAVSDFRPAEPRSTKIKKSDKTRPTSIPLAYTSDVLREVADSGADRITVGFSLEMENEKQRALVKLEDKKLDLVVMNNPSEPGCDFGSETNKVTFLYPDGKSEDLPLLPKDIVAERVMDRVEALIRKA